MYMYNFFEKYCNSELPSDDDGLFSVGTIKEVEDHVIAAEASMLNLLLQA